MSDDVKRFDRWSKTYEACWGQRFFDGVHTRMLDLLESAAPTLKPSTVLDVGCGTGRLLRKVAARWPTARIIGVDAAPGMVEVAKSLAPSGEFHQGFAESLPLPDASVDLAFSSISLHHWRDASSGMREMARVLRPEGWFCLADPTIPAWLAKVFRSKAKSQSVLREMLTEAGFEVHCHQTIFTRFVSVFVASKRLPF